MTSQTVLPGYAVVARLAPDGSGWVIRYDVWAYATTDAAPQLVVESVLALVATHTLIGLGMSTAAALVAVDSAAQRDDERPAYCPFAGAVERDVEAATIFDAISSIARRWAERDARRQW